MIDVQLRLVYISELNNLIGFNLDNIIVRPVGENSKTYSIFKIVHIHVYIMTMRYF